MKEELKNLTEKALKALGYETEVGIEIPKDPTHGDFSTNVAMKLAGQLKKSPIDIAEEIVEKMEDSELVDSVEVMKPGFINFRISASYYKELLKSIDSNFGRSNWGEGKHWLVEHTSANPNKAMHLGHLRNNLTGMAMSNIFEFIGIKVTRDYIDNNRGIAIAKLMWGFLKFAKKDGDQTKDIAYWYEHQDEWSTPSDVNKTPDKFVDELYTKASEDFKKPEVEEIVRQMVVDWEAEDKMNRALWEKVLAYSHEGQKLTMKRLGSKTDKFWHESDIYQEGKDFVTEGLEKGVFKKLEDGAIITDLKKFKIPDTVVIKKDGTSLYITQDLALTKLKRELFKPDRLFWTVGPEQSLALKQVFAVCDQLGIGKYEDYTHLAFGFMSIKGKGKMSSRLGNVVYIDDLLDDAHEIIKTKIKEEEISNEEKEDIAEKVGVGAVKYSILKVGRLTDTAFDFDSSLSFEGDSGPYLSYSYARAKSIIKKGNEDISQEINYSDFYNEESEIALLKHISKFQEIVLTAGIDLAPNLICSYLYELCQKFNQFYANCNVLNAETSEVKLARLILVNGFAQVLKNGLNLLGIDTVEKM